MNRLNSAVVRFFFPLLLASIGFIPIESNAAGELSGVVRNATGDPLIGAYVYARNPMTSQTYADYTDMSGLFEIMNMTAGEYRVRADYVGYQGAYHDGSTYEEDEPATVTVSDGTTTSGVDIMLPDGASISGKVTVQSSGLPVTNQYIPIDYRNSPNIWWSPYSYTDLMGNYQIGGLPDRDDYIIGVAATGYISDYYPGVIDYDDAEPLAITGGMDLTGIDLELTEGGVLRVAAYLESGLP
ncbi:MAG: carboxypeptidase regulatory-like domain-containing protein, partial [Candidatus Omnitrophica bacterium]|nr:carboxypeptidase regulatory-like domain-containing protein [Candidatus Omnitrophota bacterium]